MIMVVNHRIMLINHDPFLSPPENHWGFLLKHKKAYVYPSNTKQLSSEAIATLISIWKQDGSKQTMFESPIFHFLDFNCLTRLVRAGA